jgi:hypothetical protein
MELVVTPISFATCFWRSQDRAGVCEDGRPMTSVRVDKYQPELLLLEDITAKTSRRHPRIRLLIRRLQKLAAAYRIKVSLIAKTEVHDYFTMGKRLNQRRLAEAIAQLLPELITCLPRDRMPWMSEDPRARVFGAAAMGLTRYSQTHVGPPTPRPKQRR